MLSRLSRTDLDIAIIGGTCATSWGIRASDSPRSPNGALVRSRSIQQHPGQALVGVG